MAAPLYGLPVRDAKRALVVTITPGDIRKSDKKKPERCAAALALCRQLHVKEVRVFIGRTYVKRSDHWERYMTPHALRTEIVSFDRGAAFEPGDYKLLAPKGTQKLGAVHHQSRKARGTGKPARGIHFIAGVREHGPVGRQKLV